ncbi:MAG: hypothetical protein RIC16_16440 [Rhodospirillales bacterium]
MAMYHEVLHDLRLIVTVCTGHVTGREFREAYRQMAGGSEYDEIVIIADSTIMDVSIDDIRALSGFVAGAAPDDIDETLCAVVLPADQSDWFVKLYNDVSEHAGSPERTRRYDTVAAAVAALGRSDDLERISQVAKKLGANSSD